MAQEVRLKSVSRFQVRVLEYSKDGKFEGWDKEDRMSEFEIVKAVLKGNRNDADDVPSGVLNDPALAKVRDMLFCPKNILCVCCTANLLDFNNSDVSTYYNSMTTAKKIVSETTRVQADLMVNLYRDAIGLAMKVERDYDAGLLSTASIRSRAQRRRMVELQIRLMGGSFKDVDVQQYLEYYQGMNPSTCNPLQSASFTIRDTSTEAQSTTVTANSATTRPLTRQSVSLRRTNVRTGFKECECGRVLQEDIWCPCTSAIFPVEASSKPQKRERDDGDNGESERRKNVKTA
ncbi:hypothetical protein BC829DRAFT_405272 [Chytridium lagenaria]|nr:hypothetical protein BC829DRAFT_405272 [Chytridium lagenaria]